MKGGAAYGFGGAITPGTLEVKTVNTSLAMNPDGTENTKYSAMDDPSRNAMVGGRKTRKSRSKKGGKKTTRKSRKSRKSRGRKMRGGMWSPGNVNVAGVRYGFTGPTDGVRGGIAPATAEPSRVGGAPMGADGVRSA